MNLKNRLDNVLNLIINKYIYNSLELNMNHKSVLSMKSNWSIKLRKGILINNLEKVR